MAKSESIALLFSILKQSRYPVAKKTLEEKLECSTATVERYIQALRDTYMLNVVYDRELKGYHFEHDEEVDIDLPSHLFTTQEINALLLIEQIINNLEPGLLESDTKALKEHLAVIREKFSGSKELLGGNRIRMINIGKRQGNIKYLTLVMQAVLQGKQISIRYGGRSGEKSHIQKMTEGLSRTLSPQRLTHYRDNWYLDAWCHSQNALRTFALERINDLEIQKMPRKTLSHDALNEHYGQTFGIFGGEVKGTAQLKFTPHRSQWVAEEVWHKDQKGKWLDDGSYQLEIPYGSDLELIGDILKYGDQVEVLAPPSLRERVAEQVKNLVEMYC
jgi:predicted DNA-binding transcriptional regulator YafY